MFSKKSQGTVTLNAESTERRVKQNDAEFDIAPGQLLTDNLRWRLLKKHYLIDLANPVGALDGQGRPIIIVPYVSYKGWLIRRPVLGGVFVVHPDGEIEDLSPEEARKRPEITSTGRLFPDTLARRIQDAYAYKRGIWNRFVLHEEQTQISDTESNRAALPDRFRRARHQVGDGCRAIRPGLRGQCDLPDGHGHRGDRDLACTERREPQRQPPRGRDGAIRLDPGRGVRRRGRPRVGGRFKVVEPRPVFVRGRLLYLVSVIPENGNSVSKSVIVDAARNKVVAIFDNDTDPSADQATLRYLSTGDLDRAALPEQQSGTQGAAGQAPTSPRPERQPAQTPSDVQRRLDRLIQQQRETLRETEQLQREIERSK